MPKLHLLCLFLALLALPAALCAQEVRDEITLKDAPAPISGAISAETLRGVRILSGGGTLTLAREQIQKIEYDSRAGSFDDGRGSGAKAVTCEKFLKEIGPEHPRRFLRQHALFRLAEARTRDGDAARACDALTLLFTEFPESQYFVEGKTLLVENLLAQNKGEAARAIAVQAVHDAPGLGASAAAVARLELCRAATLEECGATADAAAAFGEIAGKAADAFSSRRARLGEGRCLWRLHQPEAAERSFQKVAAEATEDDLLLEAYNGMGDCALAHAGTDAAQRALLDYLRGVVLYAPASGAGSPGHARAMLGAATCFDRVRREQPTPEAQEKYRDRARALCRECADRYAGTPDAQEAEKLLARLR